MKKIVFAAAFCGALLASCAGGADKSAAGGKFIPPLMGWSSWNTYFVDKIGRAHV